MNTRYNLLFMRGHICSTRDLQKVFGKWCVLHWTAPLMILECDKDSSKDHHHQSVFTETVSL
jgi:hypothetical protein